MSDTDYFSEEKKGEIFSVLEGIENPCLYMLVDEFACRETKRLAHEKLTNHGEKAALNYIEDIFNSRAEHIARMKALELSSLRFKISLLKRIAKEKENK